MDWGILDLVANRPFLAIALFSFALVPAGRVSAQVVLDFDAWTSVCQPGDGCAGGYVEGPDGSFSLMSDPPCPMGQCLAVQWPSVDEGLAARPAPYTPPHATVHVQMRFYLAPALVERLSNGVRTEVPLLRIETASDNTWAQLSLSGSDGARFEVSSIAAGVPWASTTRIDGLDRLNEWLEVALGVAQSADGSPTLYAGIGGDLQQVPATLALADLPMITGAYALGAARYAGEPPMVLIDDVCVADDRDAARGCPAPPPPRPDAGVDAGPDAGLADTGLADTGGAGAQPSFRGAGGCACGAALADSSEHETPLVLALLFGFVVFRRRRSASSAPRPEQDER